MQQVSPGDILPATFQFVRAHLKAIAIWSAVYLVAVVIMQLGMRPYYEMQLSGQASSQAMLLFLAAYAFLIVVAVVLNAAIFRAALDPQQTDSSYLGFGMDELRLLGLLLLISILFFIATMIATIMAAFVIGFLVAAGGAGAVLGVILGIAAFIAVMIALIYFAVRLASAGPLTVLRKKITVREAWRLTRGHFWTLFGTYAVIAIIWIVVGSVIVTISLNGELSRAMFEQMRHTGDPIYRQQMIAAQLRQLNDFGPLHIIAMAVGAVAYMAMITLWCGSIAIATKLLLNKEEPASVF